MDDYTNNTSTTGVVSVGGSAAGNIETLGDHDWFRISLIAGQTYDFHLDGTSLTDPYLYLRNSSGLIIAYDDDNGPGLNSLITYTASYTGDYFLNAAAFNSYYTGTYTVSTQYSGSMPPQLDDYPADPSTIGRVPIDGCATGNIDLPGDHDWFRVALVAGHTYNFQQNGISLTDTYLYLHDPCGHSTPLDSDDDTGPGLNSLITSFTAPQTGDYFLDAAAFGSNTGTYTISAQDITPVDDYPSNPSTSGRVQIGGSTTGNIETSGDHDWFRVALVAGHTYNFQQDGISLTDTYLYLHDRYGHSTPLDSDDDSGPGLNSLITSFTAPQTGDYFLDAAAFGSNTGTYTISAQDITPVDDYPADPSTPGRVPIGGSTTGNIETPGDHDWFRVALTAGTTYDLHMDGISLTDTYLYLHDPCGHCTPLDSDDDSGPGLNSLINFTAPQNGDYLLDASGFGSNTGIYTVSAQVATPADDYAANTTTSGVVTVGGSATGNIETAADHDWFRVSLVAGMHYRIHETGSTLTDTYLYLRNSAGTEITHNDDSGGTLNSLINYAATYTGVHYIDASAYASLTGVYQVSVDLALV